MNAFLATVPFDLYELSLFHLVAERRSFTGAGRQAGLTQSAITRQIRGIEDQLGLALFERTTRRVSLTPAGRRLYEKSKGIVARAEAMLRQLQQEFSLVPQTLRIGVARSIGLAYLPGFLVAFRRRLPAVQIQVAQRDSREILAAVEAGDLDAALLSPPRRLPTALTATHRFKDAFTLVVPPDSGLPAVTGPASLKSLRRHLASERWLLLERNSQTGTALRRWLEGQNLDIEPAMELDSFDVIVNLVALGLGVSLVPHRVLALYGGRRRVRRIALRPRFTRELAVVVRKNRQQPEPLATFLGSILFKS
ncbi:MAG: LysR family transcriptional regulator [Limisphaerales bacterium]